MKIVERVDLEEFILSALTPQERLDAALKLAREAFRDTTLTSEDLEVAIQKVRRRIYRRQAKNGARML
jgi:predicted Zn-dependent peptidase